MGVRHLAPLLPDLPQASCKGLPADEWFPVTKQPPSRLVLRICQGCPEQQPCLEYAIEHGITHGIWGGLTTRARGRLVRERQQRASA